LLSAAREDDVGQIPVQADSRAGWWRSFDYVVVRFANGNFAQSL
jgi:hypothetical protein